MLSTRSARLAASLLLALLAGWIVRTQRLRHATPASMPKALPRQSVEKFQKNSFPDE